MSADLGLINDFPLELELAVRSSLKCYDVSVVTYAGNAGTSSNLVH